MPALPLEIITKIIQHLPIKQYPHLSLVTKAISTKTFSFSENHFKNAPDSHLLILDHNIWKYLQNNYLATVIIRVGLSLEFLSKFLGLFVDGWCKIYTNFYDFPLLLKIAPSLQLIFKHSPASWKWNTDVLKSGCFGVPEMSLVAQGNGIPFTFSSFCQITDIVKAGLCSEMVSSTDVIDAMHIAAYHGHNQILSMLLTRKDVHLCQSFRLMSGSVLETACKRGNVKSVSLLLSDQRCNPGYDSNKALFVAVCNGHVGVVRLLLSDSRILFSNDSFYACIQAAEMLQDPGVLYTILEDSRFRTLKATMN